MEKTCLKQIVSLFPFDSNYVKVSKGKLGKIKWNLMDSTGKLISDTWFSSIEKNSDGSIITQIPQPRKADVEAKFISVGSLAKSSQFFKTIPFACFSFIDSNSAQPYSCGKYVAKATFDGETVFIDKNGNIYDKDGVNLRLLLNTVDSERIIRATDAFNRKMNYGFSKPECSPENNSMQLFCEKKIAMWAFYFLTDYLHFNSGFSGSHHIRNSKDIKKWTDNLVFRAFPSLIPESVQNALKEKFGEPNLPSREKYPWAYENKDLFYWTWKFEKKDLDRVIDVLNSF